MGLSRKDVWVELLNDGRYQVRWRGGDWHGRDGSWRTNDKRAAWAEVRKLLDDGGDWKRVEGNERPDGA